MFVPSVVFTVTVYVPFTVVNVALDVYVCFVPSGDVTSYVVVPALPGTNVVFTSSFTHTSADGVNVVLVVDSLNVIVPTVN